MPYKNPVKRRAYVQKYLDANREKARARARAWYVANREKARAYQTAFRKRHPQKHNRAAYQQRRYPDISRPQPAACECCMRTFTEKLKPCVDHNHTTGKFRGWLCHGCNAALGLLGEDAERIRRLTEYCVEHDRLLL